MGHTLLYDIGAELASNDIFGILHADMVIGQGYVENLLKHMDKDKIVCATRIEPPLHPPGKEKIVENFGIEYNEFNESGFEAMVKRLQREDTNKTTKGIFAPWIIHKDTFFAVGGHDPIFAPYPYEDSDLFQRLILNGVEPIQSRDSFVYHFTCRGHRWTEKIGVNSNEYLKYEKRARENYLRKWQSWVANDDNMCPKIPPRYNIAYRVVNCGLDSLKNLEIASDRVYVDAYEEIGKFYIREEQKLCGLDMTQRVRPIDEESTEDIVISCDAAQITMDDYWNAHHMPHIIHDSDIGEITDPVDFELGNLKIQIRRLEDISSRLIDRKSESYKKLICLPS